MLLLVCEFFQSQSVFMCSWINTIDTCDYVCIVLLSIANVANGGKQICAIVYPYPYPSHIQLMACICCISHRQFNIMAILFYLTCIFVLHGYAYKHYSLAPFQKWKIIKKTVLHVQCDFICSFFSSFFFLFYYHDASIFMVTVYGFNAETMCFFCHSLYNMELFFFLNHANVSNIAFSIISFSILRENKSERDL